VAGESGGEGTVSIVGVDAIDPARGCVSFSPMATALLTARVDDVVTIRTPRGTEELEIIAIRYDEL
jgi:transcription elongation factor GreB